MIVMMLNRLMLSRPFNTQTAGCKAPRFCIKSGCMQRTPRELTTHRICQDQCRAHGAPGQALTLPPIMNFFDSTLRDWKLMLLPMAAAKPPQSNVTCAQQAPSAADAQPTAALVLQSSWSARCLMASRCVLAATPQIKPHLADGCCSDAANNRQQRQQHRRGGRLAQEQPRQQHREEGLHGLQHIGARFAISVMRDSHFCADLLTRLR